MPLTLHEPPWHHLPVGVVSVFSTHYGSVEEGEDPGLLQEFVRDPERLSRLEDLVKGPVADLLDPRKRLASS